MRVAALVVSYNRRELLRNCLDALHAQSHSLDAIVVVDNRSTDGSVEMVAGRYPNVTLLSTQVNAGGAGGFAAGIQHLLLNEYDAAWLMDDDAEPRADALEPLVRAMESTARDPAKQAGFVASNVLTPDGTKISPSKYPPPHPSIAVTCETPPGTTPAGYATFVGVLINLHHARNTFLPLADFFIWWDDTEYTSRLQQTAGGFYCAASVVYHAAKPELADLKGRLRYDLRNRLWIIRDRRLGSPTALMKARGLLWNRIRTQARNAESKRSYARNLVRGLWEGGTSRPRLVMPVVKVESAAEGKQAAASR